jgi:hypothetical protein
MNPLHMSYPIKGLQGPDKRASVHSRKVSDVGLEARVANGRKHRNGGRRVASMRI